MPIQIKERVTQRSKDVDMRVYVSPRIGVSHPISDVAAMYFSYSRNSTPPPYSRLYANYNNFGNTSLPNNPSVEQNPYQSNNYELGVQWEFYPKIGLNFNAYLRDIENYGYASFTVIPRSGPSGQTYGLGFSAGYADSRGVEVTLDAQRQSFFDGFLNLSGKANYTYSYIKASAFAGCGCQDADLSSALPMATALACRAGFRSTTSTTTTRSRPTSLAAPARLPVDMIARTASATS